MKRSAIAFILLVFFAVSASRAGVVAGGTGDGTVWFASETIGGTRLNLMTPGGDGGGFIVGPEISRLPAFISSGGARTIIVFEVPGGVRPVREIGAEFGPGDQLLGVRMEPLTPLPQDGVLAGVAATPRDVFVLLTGLQFPLETDTPESFAQGPALVQLTRGGWERRALPGGIVPANPWRLVAIDSTPAIIEQTDAQHARVWFRDADGGWNAQVWSIPAGSRDIIPSHGGVLVERKRGDGVDVSFVRGESSQSRGEFKGVPNDHALAPLADGVIVIGVDRTGAEPHLWGARLAGDGVLRFEGALKPQAPINRRDIETLVVLVVSAGLTTLFFLLRIGHEDTGVIKLPAGVSIAPTWKRAAAAIMDLAPGVFLVAWWWPMQAGGQTMAEMSMAYGPWPLVTVGGVMFLHSALCEWLFGRTLGKALAGCRTISTRTGGHPTLGQALGRNFIKVACPPLGMVQAMTPGRPEVWGFGTTVVMPTPPAETPPGEGR